jgi:hypothetical protein
MTAGPCVSLAKIKSINKEPSSANRLGGPRRSLTATPARVRDLGWSWCRGDGRGHQVIMNGLRTVQDHVVAASSAWTLPDGRRGLTGSWPSGQLVHASEATSTSTRVRPGPALRSTPHELLDDRRTLRWSRASRVSPVTDSPEPTASAFSV